MIVYLGLDNQKLGNQTEENNDRILRVSRGESELIGERGRWIATTDSSFWYGGGGSTMHSYHSNVQFGMRVR